MSVSLSHLTGIALDFTMVSFVPVSQMISFLYKKGSSKIHVMSKHFCFINFKFVFIILCVWSKCGHTDMVGVQRSKGMERHTVSQLIGQTRVMRFVQPALLPAAAFSC
mgnify:CR=1 FL=1